MLSKRTCLQPVIPIFKLVVVLFIGVVLDMVFGLRWIFRVCLWWSRVRIFVFSIYICWGVFRFSRFWRFFARFQEFLSYIRGSGVYFCIFQLLFSSKGPFPFFRSTFLTCILLFYGGCFFHRTFVGVLFVMMCVVFLVTTPLSADAPSRCFFWLPRLPG